MTHLDSFDFGQVFNFDDALLGQDNFVGSAVGYLAGVTAPYCGVAGFG